MLNQELKQEIVDFIKSNNTEHSALNLRQLFNVTSKQLTDAFKDDTRIETIRYETGVIKFKFKREINTARPENKRMTGVLKRDIAYKLAIARCEAERGGEFSNISLASKVKEFDHLAGR
jgi:hypothetical protein